MKGDLNFRYNILAILLIFLNFWRTYLMARLGSAAALMVVSALAPLLVVGVPLAAYPLVERRLAGKSYPRAFADSYRVKKCKAPELCFGAAAGIAGYFAYAYLYSAAVCLHEYAAKSLVLYAAPAANGWYVFTVLMQGVFTGFALELLLRGGSRYQGLAGWIIPVLYGMMLGFTVDACVSALFLGLMTTALTRRTGNSLPAALCGAIFATLGLTVGNFVDLPFTFRLVTSVEGALYSAMMSAAFGFLAAGICVLFCMAARKGALGLKRRPKEPKALGASGEPTAEQPAKQPAGEPLAAEPTGEQPFTKDSAITLGAAVAVYALLCLLYWLV